MGMAKKEKPEPPMYRDRDGAVSVPVEKTPEEIEKLPLVRVTGTVRLVGSSMFAEIVINGSSAAGEDGIWYIGEQDKEQFISLQQRTVTVEGMLDSETAALISGQQFVRLILRNPRIIKIE
jgi:hypothetical protein